MNRSILHAFFALILFVCCVACSKDEVGPSEGILTGKVGGKAWKSAEAVVLFSDGYVKIRARAEDGSLISLNIRRTSPGDYATGSVLDNQYDQNKAIFVPADWQSGNNYYTLYSTRVSSIVGVPHDQTNAGGTITITNYQESSKLLSGKFKIVAVRRIINQSGGFSHFEDLEMEGAFLNIPVLETPEGKGSASINGLAFNPSLSRGGSSIQNIGFIGEDSKQSIIITIPANVVPGTYKLDHEPWGTGHFHGLYKIDGGPSSNTGQYHARNGTVTITNHDLLRDRLAGTFWFDAAKDGEDEIQYKITAGTFDVSYPGF